MKLAILSPNENAYSETFIQAHKDLPFEIFFYCNGRIPSQLAGTSWWLRLIHKAWFKLKFWINKKFSSSEHLLKYLLQKKKVNCVLAEYGVTAAETLSVIKSLGLPLIVHFHGFDASDKKFLQKYKERYIEVFKYAKSVISVSKKMSNDLIALGCPADKIFLNTYGPNDAYFSVKPTFTLKNFTAIGRFVEKKAPQLTIRAFSKVVKQYPDARLFFGGEGKLLDDCKKLVGELGIENQVSFLGILSKPQIMELFSESLAFVQHSITAKNGDSEGTPLAVMEASAAGLPVIATRHAGIPDVIEDGITGFLVDERDIESMANYMKELCKNREEAKLMGLRGSNYIQSNFTIEKHLSYLTDLIYKAANNKQSNSDQRADLVLL